MFRNKAPSFVTVPARPSRLLRYCFYTTAPIASIRYIRMQYALSASAWATKRPVEPFIRPRDVVQRPMPIRPHAGSQLGTRSPQLRSQLPAQSFQHQALALTLPPFLFFFYLALRLALFASSFLSSARFCIGSCTALPYRGNYPVVAHRCGPPLYPVISCFALIRP